MKYLVFVLLTAVLIGYSFFDKKGKITKYHHDGIEEIYYSQNPPLGRTGAPGEGNCTACHSGTTQSAAGTINYSFSGANNEYLPGQSYTIDLSIPAGAKNGFEMTILDDSDNAAGSFTAGTNSSTGSFNGREYIRHSASSGVTSWSFTWNAPSTDVGNLTAFYAFNESNSNGSNSGDVIYLGQEAISISPSVDLTKLEKLEKEYYVTSDPNNKQLNVSYQLMEPSNVVLNVIDINGKLVYRKSFGEESRGDYQKTIDYSSFGKNGIYFVSVLIGNYALDTKVLL